MKYLSTIFLLFILFTVQGQIKKGNWLIGGEVSFNSQNVNIKFSDGNSQLLGTGVNILPNLGYFVKDKLALGVFTAFGQSSGDEFDANVFGIGPFARYYFLDTHKKFNLFADIRYLYQTANTESLSSRAVNSFLFKAGSTYFFTKNIGIEATLNYIHVNSFTDANRFNFGFGLQVNF